MRSRYLGLLGCTALIAIGLLAATRARAVDFKVHGTLDLVADEYSEAYDFNLLTRGDSPFDAFGLRLFADSQLNPRLQLFTQFVARDAIAPYVDGAYVSFTPSPGRDLHLLAGKVPWAIGTYAPRTYSNKNPLIGTPLMYQYHTTLVWYEIAPSADKLLATAGSGQYGINYFGYAEGLGMPLVDDSYWDTGATLVGSARPIEYALGMGLGTPGWGNTTQDENAGKTVLGRLGLAPMPWVRVGVSGAYGPYIVQSKNPKLPADHTVADYHQKLGMADAELQIGHLEARAEAARNIWETPRLGLLGVSSGYAELKYTLSCGWFVAGRGDAIRFGKISDSAGTVRTWDSNVTRIEGGIGYRFDRQTIAKVVYQQTIIERFGREDRRLPLVAAQLSVGF